MEKKMKKIFALVAALLITASIGVGMLVLGGSALFNRPAVAQAAAAPNQASVQQLQDLVTQYQQREQQYQQREQQYQSELDNARQQLQDASGQIAQYQNLLAAMQEAGIIRVDQDGRIFVPQGDFRNGRNLASEGGDH